jgi:hypothetical protein
MGCSEDRENRVRGGAMRVKHWVWVVLLLIVCTSSCSFTQQPVKPVVTRTTVSSTPTGNSLETCATDNATSFYQDIQKHQLQQAYRYIDPQGRTEDGQKLTYSTFTQQVQMGGTSQGPFSIEIGGYQASISEVTMTITNHQFRYHSHLQFRFEGSTCKIVMLDRI